MTTPALDESLDPPGWLDLGATERHNRGHYEDSYELDETTMDGDTDLVLHFKIAESGLQGTETEACVKGEFTDDIGTGDRARLEDLAVKRCGPRQGRTAGRGGLGFGGGR